MGKKWLRSTYLNCDFDLEIVAAAGYTKNNFRCKLNTLDLASNRSLLIEWAQILSVKGKGIFWIIGSEFPFLLGAFSRQQRLPDLLGW